MADEAKTEEAGLEDNTNSGIGLSLMDLRNVITIIDVASERGAWKGPELSKIGSVREKFVEVITALSPEEVKQEGEATETEVTETEVTETEAAPEAEATPEAAA